MTLILSGTNGLSDVDGSAATPAIRGTDTNTGIFFPAADTVGISTGGTERARVDSSGNLGLGVTPSAWTVGKTLQISSANGPFFYGAGQQGIWGVNAYYGSGGWTYGGTGYATYYEQSSNGVHNWRIAASGTAGNAITFTQAMTLDASGRLLVGATTDYGFGGKILTRGGGVVASSSTWDNSTTGGAIAMFCDNANYGTIWALKNGNQAWGDVAIAPSGGNLLVGTTSANGSYNTRLTLSSDSGTTKWAVGPYSSATNFVVSAGSNGVYLAGTSATSWSSASDERAKADLQPIENGLQKVCSLRALTGRYIEDETNTRKSFLIAQDVLAVLPEAVDTANPEKYGLAYTDTIPLLVAAIKELKAEFDAYKASHP